MIARSIVEHVLFDVEQDIEQSLLTIVSLWIVCAQVKLDKPAISIGNLNCNLVDERFEFGRLLP